MSPRRLLVAAAVIQYPLAPQLDRRELVEDVARMERVLCGSFGYERQGVLPPNPKSEDLKNSLRRFAKRSCREDDYVVLYLAGHGDVLDSGKHILLPADTDPEDLLERAVKTADLAEWMLEETPLRRLMVILDCCYAGEGGKQLVREAVGGWDGQGSLVVITATRPRQQAQPGVFTEAFRRAVRNEDRAAGGYAAFALSCQAIVDHIRRDVHVPGFQTATTVHLGSGDDLHFLPNPEYNRQLVDLDIDAQERLRREHRAYLHDRFLPATQWFIGRHRALTDLTSWLTAADGDRRARLVTGDPGSGKTAVLGLLAALADPERGPAIPRDGLPSRLPPPGSFDAVIYAGTLPTESVLTAVAAAAGVKTDPTADSSTRIRDLIDALPRFAKPLTVLIDALDEAADPEGLARHVLRPLIDLGGDRLRLLVGTRAHLVPMLGPGVVAVDLDDSTYADPASVRAYVRRVLLQSHPDSPYRTAPDDVLEGVADAVGDVAGTSFLVARILAQTLAAATRTADPDEAAWRASLPRGAGAAMSQDLRTRLGDQETRARELLLPLAYAQGAGLPWSGVWPQLANALCPGRTYTDDDVVWLRTSAGSYFREGTADGSVYRLFHQSLVEHLREGRDTGGDHATITQALIDCVPPASGGGRDWWSADLYIRTHLAIHAARGRRLDDLLTDPDYMLAADRIRLLAALPLADSDLARANADAYRRAAPLLATKPTIEHASYLEMAARCGRAPRLADTIAARYPHRPWSTRWASWQMTRPHRTFLAHARGVNAVAVAKYQGRPVVVTAGNDRAVRVWELSTGASIGKPFIGHRFGVYAVAATEDEGRTVVVSVSFRGVRVHDLGTGARVRDWKVRRANRVNAVAVTRYQGRAVVVCAGDDRTVRLRELGTGKPVGDPFTGHSDSVQAVTVTEYQGGQVAVSAGSDGTVWTSELGTGKPVGDPFTGHRGRVNAVATAEYEGRPVVVSADSEGIVWASELGSGIPVGDPFTGHIGWVDAVAVTEVEGSPIVVSAGHDGTVRMSWLGSGAPVHGPFTGHTDTVRAVAVATYDGGPVAISGSWDRTIRVWELSADTSVGDPFTGHTERIGALAVAQYQGRPVVVSASDDRTVRVWDLGTGTPIGDPFAGHRALLTAVATAEYEGRPVVVSAGHDGTVRVWELGTGTPIGAFNGHTTKVSAMATAEYEGRPVVVSASYDGTVRVWELGTGTPIGDPFTGHGLVTAVAVAEYQGQLVVVSAHTGHTVRVSELATGATVGKSFADHRAAATAVAVAEYQDRKVVICLSNEGTVQVWELGTGTPIGDPFNARTWGTAAMATAKYQGRPVVVSAGDDGTVRVWDLATGSPVGAPFTGHTKRVNAVVVTEYQGRPVVVSAGDERTARVSELATGAPVGDPFTGHIGGVNAVAVAEYQGRPVVVSAGNDGRVRAWELATGAPVGDPLTGRYRPVKAVAHGGPVRDPLTGHYGPVKAVGATEYQGRPVVVSAGDDGMVRVWELGTGAPVGDPFEASEDEGVQALAVTTYEGGPVVISGSSDDQVRVWELGTGAPGGKSFARHRGGVTAVAVAECEGRPVVISAGRTGEVRVGDLASHRAIGQRLASPGGAVNALQAVPSGNGLLLFAGTEAGTVATWQLTDMTRKRPRWLHALLKGRREPMDRRHYQHAVRALAVLRHSDRVLVGHGPIIELEGARGSQVIDVGATVLALATAPAGTVIASTDRGIVALDVPRLPA
jgi:WD40 repeat protein